MSYHELSECTLTALERFREKNEILRIIKESGVEGWQFLDKEWRFLQTMIHARDVSVKQLFWLRDIKQKYLEK